MIRIFFYGYPVSSNNAAIQGVHPQNYKNIKYNFSTKLGYETGSTSIKTSVVETWWAEKIIGRRLAEIIFQFLSYPREVSSKKCKFIPCY